MSDAAAAPTPGAPREAAADGEPRSARELVLDALLDADGPMTPDMAMAATGITAAEEKGPIPLGARALAMRMRDFGTG
jgi:hypothetical protein